MVRSSSTVESTPGRRIGAGSPSSQIAVRFKIHHALFAGFLGIIALLVLLLGVLVGSRVREDLTEAFEAELTRQLNLTASILEDVPEARWDSLVTSVGGDLGHRITVIGVEGRVLADSDVRADSVPQLENHATRPEVVGALSGTRTFAQRTSTTVNEPLLYGAQRVELGGRSVILRMAAPLTRVEAAVDRLRGGVILTGVLVSFVALVLAWILSVGLAWPLASLADQARKLAGGDLSLRVPTGRRVGEMENLAQAFNRLSAELQARMDELSGERDEIQRLLDSLDEGVLSLDPDGRIVRWNTACKELLAFPDDLVSGTAITSLVEDRSLKDFLLRTARGIRARTEVRIEERDLVLASHPLPGSGGVAGILDVSEIRRLERVRRDFVANASHELKTPLTSIRGYAETLLEGDPEGDPDGDLRETFLNSIFNNTIRLQSMVDDLLDLSRLESGGWVADQQQVEVEVTAREAFEPIRDKAAGCSFDVQGSGRALADPAGLSQVFRNLYENALRHTPPGGHIGVRVRRELDVVHVAVSDDGEGIPLQALPRIFERFYRADSSRARDHGGTGLGLAIVRHLVSSMGGHVWAESEVGSGTTIHMTLPRPDRRPHGEGAPPVSPSAPAGGSPAAPPDSGRPAPESGPGASRAP